MNTRMAPKRKYDSSRRKMQARQTRQDIIEAARRLFIERGYSGATIEAISQEANVAVETIYASFGNKREILSRLISVTLVGDDKPTPLLQRQGPLKTLHDKDQKRQIQLFAIDMTVIMGRMAPLFEVMRSAAKTESDIAILLQKILSERVEGMKVFVGALMSNGLLRDGLGLEEAAETTWALSSGEVYTLLVFDRGWPTEKYSQWLVSALSNLLLP